MNKKANSVLFIAYLAIILYLTLINRNQYSYHRINYRLFTNLEFVASHSFKTFLYYFAGNILIFVPMGFFSKNLFKQSFMQTLILVLLVSFFIETSQYILKVGIFELDDLVLNTLGGFLGYLIAWIVNKFRIKHKKEDNYV